MNAGWYEQLATMVARQFAVDPARLLGIAHAGARPELERDESSDLVAFAWDGERFSGPRWQRVAREVVERLIGQQLEDVAPARGGAEEAMMTDGQWYILPDGTRVQARAQGMGTWHLVATDGTPAYVVFGNAARGFHIRRLVFQGALTDNPGAEGRPTPVAQAVPCDLTLDDLRTAPTR